MAKHTKAKKSGDKKPHLPTLSCTDPTGELRKGIMAAIEGTEVTIGEFMRTAIHDRLHDVEVAQARCAFDAEEKVVISGIVDMAVLDAYCVERTQAMLNGDD